MIHFLCMHGSLHYFSTMSLQEYELQESSLTEKWIHTCYIVALCMVHVNNADCYWYIIGSFSDTFSLYFWILIYRELEEAIGFTKVFRLLVDRKKVSNLFFTITHCWQSLYTLNIKGYCVLLIFVHPYSLYWAITCSMTLHWCTKGSTSLYQVSLIVSVILYTSGIYNPWMCKIGSFVIIQRLIDCPLCLPCRIIRWV